MCWLLSCQHFTVPRRDLLAGPFDRAANITALPPRSRSTASRPAPMPSAGGSESGSISAPPACSPPVVSGGIGWKPALDAGPARSGRGRRGRRRCPSRPTVRPPASSGSPVDGPLSGAVEVQQDQHARRFAQVVDARDGLLAAVAALVQVHGPPGGRSSRPRAGSSARRCPRPAGAAAPPPGAPHRPRCRPGARPAAGQSCQPAGTSVARHQQVELDVRRLGGGHPAHESAAGQRRPRSGPRAARRCPVRPATAALGSASRARAATTPLVGGLGEHVGPEDHLAQVGQQRLAAPRLGVEVGDPAQLGLDPVILDTALAVEAEILGEAPSGSSATCWLEMSAASCSRSAPVSVITAR